MMKSKLIKNALGIIPELLKDRNKKWSAKRTISGVLVYVVADYLSDHDLSWMVVCFTFVSVLPLCLSFMENNNQCCKN